VYSKFSHSYLFAFVCGALVVAIAFGVGLSVASLQSASAAEPAQAVQQWEYKTVVVESAWLGPFGFADTEIELHTKVGENSNDETFNYIEELGKDGWELVSFVNNLDGLEGTMIFKRPLK